MTPAEPPPADGRAAGNPIAGGWSRRDVDIISRHMAAAPPVTDGHGTAPRPARTAPTRRRPRLLASQVAALAVLGCALLALLVGALSVIGRGDAPPPQIATRPPTDAGRAATKPPAIDSGPADEPTRRSEAGADLADPGTAGGSSAVTSATGEAVVRAFYAALGRGDGARASALVVVEKRGGGPFSPRAISRFYGALPEPLRLTAITPLAPEVYRVSYRYSAGRSRCDGAAVVTLTPRNGRDFIRSIRALNGC